MTSDEWIEVGKVRDAHGLKGEVFIVPFSEGSDWIDKSESLRVVTRSKNEDGEWDYQRSEYKIKRKKPHKVGYIVLFDEINNRNQSEALKGARIEVNKSLLVSRPGESIYLEEINGFKVVTESIGEIGSIISFSSNGAQDLLVVESKKGKFEIPFVEAFIVKINWDERTIEMDLPEGLVEL